MTSLAHHPTARLDLAADLVGAWAAAPVVDPAPLGPPLLLLGQGVGEGARSIAAVGVALSLAAPGGLVAAARAQIAWSPRPPESSCGPFVVALPYAAPGQAAEWRGLEGPLAVAPQLLYERRGGTARLFAFAPGPASRAAERRVEQALAAGLATLEQAALAQTGEPTLAGASPGLDPARRPRGEGVRRLADPGARRRWGALVASALAAIDRGDLQKVVLARAFEVVLAAPPAPGELFARLRARHPTCHAFWLQGDGCAFAGATPETFARLSGRALSCDALAGTAAQGGELLSSEKDLREQRAVVDDLVRRLAPLSEEVTAAAEPRVLALRGLSHLRTEVTARLLPGRHLDDLAQVLHPTPAVGGTPRAAALAFQEQHEGLDRGLYAGLLGLVGPEGGELLVALRCALLRGPRARLFAGAGIVAGSAAEAEWDETELKARALLSALEAGE